MALKLKAVKHAKSSFNGWCGPAAISAIAGVTAERAAKMIADLRGGRRLSQKRGSGAGAGITAHGVSGTYNSEMQTVLHQLGYHIELLDITPRRPTLAAWEESRGPLRLDLLLVNITGHYVVVQGDRVVDNHRPKGAVLSELKQHRRSRVRQVWRITKNK